MNIADVNEAFGLLAERRSLMQVRAEPNCLLNQVGRFHDQAMIEAVLPVYSAELDRRISVLTEQIAALGVDLSKEQDEPNGAGEKITLHPITGATLTYERRSGSYAQPTTQPEG